MTELKRALVDMTTEFGECTDEQSEEFLGRLLLRLAAGSPEVIEAMARDYWTAAIGTDWEDASAPKTKQMFRNRARAALAAGMKVVANG